ncbi:hypothetical protein BC835DRAFT_496927 [Cytidiella melzeri]|nr:hypothetical protein BC835DRAFT_496927 [Cytidiella melzeri]
MNRLPVNIPCGLLLMSIIPLSCHPPPESHRVPVSLLPRADEQAVMRGPTTFVGFVCVPPRGVRRGARVCLEVGLRVFNVLDCLHDGSSCLEDRA